MGRDAKPFLNAETPRPAFPLPRRTSLTGSFSLPTLSLSSRSKPAPPSLPPLDLSGAASRPLDDDSTASSCVTSSSSQPFPSISAESQTRPSSPLKPPTSPGPSVPLPSIRSLRSRFSFSSGSPDQANTPPRGAPTPQKRVASRRFLPFGNSNSSASNNNPTANVPRKSLGDVFALGRSSTSSRPDAVSIRSGTPSGRSSRSVTSAATLRGWGSTSKHLEPGPPHARLSFGRPRSHDYSLDSDLGFVLSIGAPDETIRQRPAISASNSSPLISGLTVSVEESSQENIEPSAPGDVTTCVSLPAPPQATEIIQSLAQADAAPTRINYTGQLVSTITSRPSSQGSSRLSSKRPSPLELKSSTESQTERAKTPTTVVEHDDSWDNATSATYPFTPVDDRSDVTSSTHNTPSSAKASSRDIRAVVPPLPSPTPFRSMATGLGSTNEVETSVGNPRQAVSPSSYVVVSDTYPSARQAVSKESLFTPSSSSQSSHREHAVMGLLGELDGALSAIGSAQQPARIEPESLGSSNLIVLAGSQNGNGAVVDSSAGNPSRVLPESEAAWQVVPPDGKAALEKHHERVGQLTSSLAGGGVNNAVSPAVDSDRLTSQHDGQRNPASALDRRPSRLRDDPNSYFRPSAGSEHDTQLSHVLDEDLVKLLSPNRLAHLSQSAPNSALVPTIALPPPSPRYSPQPFASGSRTPQTPSSLDSRGVPGSRYEALAPSPSPLFRASDTQIPLTPHYSVASGVSNTRGSHSAKKSPVLSRATTATASPSERSNLRGLSSPSSGFSRVGMTRKRSASFDLSGSTTFTRDPSDPFSTHLNHPRRADWLGPRTAKAFAAAGLLDNARDKERLSPISSARSDSSRGTSWRMQQSEANGRIGNIRSHSRLGSETISTSSLARPISNGPESSPSYRRGSLDHTAPPSPVSTHRTLVSSVASSSQSQQSTLQALRERHELETEALLLALAGSKKSERDLRLENEQLLYYIKELEQRVVALENDRESERGQWSGRERAWDTSFTSNADSVDRRHQDILPGRPLTRVWSAHNRTKSIARNRSPTYGGGRTIPSPSDKPRSASAVGIYRGDFDVKLRSATPPTKQARWASLATHRASSRVPSPSQATAKPPTDSSVEFEKWHEDAFIPPSDSNLRLIGSQAPDNNSATSLIPQLPGSMTLLMQEAGPFSEDEYSFRSASPSSLTLVQPRNSTPKPCPPTNISPVTAEFSFNSIPGSPRSLRLRPDEEIHLAELISLQGLEITDVLDDVD